MCDHGSLVIKRIARQKGEMKIKKSLHTVLKETLLDVCFKSSFGSGLCKMHAFSAGNGLAESGDDRSRWHQTVNAVPKNLTIRSGNMKV